MNEKNLIKFGSLLEDFNVINDFYIKNRCCFSDVCMLIYNVLFWSEILLIVLNEFFMIND